MHVINALSDNEHPCQALADLQTLKDVWGGWRGGSSPSSATATTSPRRWRRPAVMLGTTVHIASPDGYELPSAVVEQAMRVARHGAEIRLFRDPVEAVKGADAVYTDVWTSMGQEAETAERKRAFDGYQVTTPLMRAARDRAAVPALPARPPRRRSLDRGVRVAGIGRVRSGREPPARQKALLLTLMGNHASSA